MPIEAAAQSNVRPARLGRGAASQYASSSSGLSLAADHVLLSAAAKVARDGARPVPPPIGSGPVPPPVDTGSGRPIPPAIDPGYGSSRPVPPAVDPGYGSSGPIPPAIDPSVPVPPAIDPRPVPPIVDPYDPYNTRPVPPIVDPYDPSYPRPVPPPVDPLPGYPPIDPYPVGSSPQQILDSFEQEHSQLKYQYNNTSMTQSEFNSYERSMYTRVAGQIVAASGYPFADREQILKQIYNETGMTQTEFSGYERQLYQSEANRIVNSSQYSSFDEREATLKSVYNSTGMTQTEFNTYDHQLIRQEVNRILYLPASLQEKTDMINHLYNASSMTSSERDDAIRQIQNSYFGPYPVY